ncbi:MAG TPA: hypothetical protein VGN16_21545 [Acidobacteriaceae bacterium]|jgi:hypothetical protein
MQKDIHFWFTTLFRGFIALFTGSGILVIPDMARTILLLPFAITFAVVGLAAYGILDSTMIFVSSFMVNSRRTRLALRLQGTVGVAVGALLLFVVADRVQLAWFLSLAALQALGVAVGEFVVARHQQRHAISFWNYSAAAIAACFAISYLVVRFESLSHLTYRDVSLLIYAYLVTLGIAQCLTAARMIYADYHTSSELGTPVQS